MPSIGIITPFETKGEKNPLLGWAGAEHAAGFCLWVGGRVTVIVWHRCWPFCFMLNISYHGYLYLLYRDTQEERKWNFFFFFSGRCFNRSRVPARLWPVWRVVVITVVCRSWRFLSQGAELPFSSSIAGSFHRWRRPPSAEPCFLCSDASGCCCLADSIQFTLLVSATS